ncbi:MAG: DUF5655 domain-containing protein, partial [Clostridiales bacterium]|nr:DUF5655 domain-containing protein [Clostridiales bacterium]
RLKMALSFRLESGPYCPTLTAPFDSERIALKTEPYSGRWTHHIVVSSPEELDEELLSWIKTAYTFVDAK